jgi:hypothetical protein
MHYFLMLQALKINNENRKNKEIKGLVGSTPDPLSTVKLTDKNSV